jgi:diadenosine tetraphosphatase ApaH/serine/threonine PP2A family protein phosphatase
VRYLIVSDLHGNWEALESVAGEAAGRCDRILCCGDLVGYCAQPNEVVDWARPNCVRVVRGNHDKACAGLEDMTWFNSVAREAALWTERALTPENKAYVAALPRGPALLDGFELIHGAPYDEDEYVIAAGEAENAFEYLEQPLAFFGHTHVQGGYIRKGARLETIPRIPPRADTHLIDIDPAFAYLLNPGSVGQPRDGDPRAAFAIYDSDAGIVAFRRVAYDVAAAQRRIREAGLPPILADRLSAGR